MQNITIVGGSAGFGEWVARFISEKFSAKINLTITGRNEENLKRLSYQIGCKYSTSNIDAVKDADITIFAVPIAFMVDTIKEVAPHLKAGGVVLDVTSIKGGPARALNKYSPESVLVIPTHPMFGPFVSTIAGQIFVLTPEEEVKSDKRYVALTNYLTDAGAKVIESSAKEHDKMMAVVQGLTHFNMFVLGETIKRLELDILKSMDFVSPIYKLMISSVARYVGQNPKLYGDIQMFNEEVLEIHKTFMEVTNDFNIFVKEKDEDSFISTIEKTREYFGDQTKIGQRYTDKIIYMIGKQIEKAEESIGKEVGLVNIYSGEKISGVLENYSDNYIYLDNKESYCLDEWEIK